MFFILLTSFVMFKPPTQILSFAQSAPCVCFTSYCFSLYILRNCRRKNRPRRVRLPFCSYCLRFSRHLRHLIHPCRLQYKRRMNTVPQTILAHEMSLSFIFVLFMVPIFCRTYLRFRVYIILLRMSRNGRYDFSPVNRFFPVPFLLKRIYYRI